MPQRNYSETITEAAPLLGVLVGVKKLIDDYIREQVNEAVAAADQGEAGLLDTEGACHYLCVSRTKLHELRRDGKVKTVKIGDAVRFSRRELDRFIKKSEAA